MATDLTISVEDRPGGLASIGGRPRRRRGRPSLLPIVLPLVNLHASAKSSSFTESVIREMTRLAAVHDAINLGQGYPDFPAPEEVKEAARRAIAEDHNQYPITWGDPTFRRAIAAKYAADYGMTLDPETEICVTCGSTEAMAASFLGILDEGDEVVVFEPFYESYNPDAILSGATGRYVTLYPPDWRFDPDELAEAFGPRTRAIVVNSPHNPTGKVFTAEELGMIAGLCRRHDVIAITDEIYEHITYEDREHVPIRTVEDVLRHGLARRVGGRSAAVDGGDPFDARLPDGRGRGAAADRGGGGARLARRVLPADPEGVRRAPRPDVGGPRGRGLHSGSAGGRVLRDGRRHVARFR